MSGNLVPEGATVTCTHGGSAAFTPAQSRVQVRGRPVATIADRYHVTGCPFSTNAGPHPCATVTWQNPAVRVRANGSPVLLQSSSGLGQAADQAPQGPVTISVIQQEVVGR